MTSNNLTRERIEKVKKNVCISLDSLADENGEVAKSHKDDLNTILTLANAELERQSVTDEDVVEAIQFLEIINHPQFAMWDKKQRKALSLATEALQAYRPVEVTDANIYEAIDYFKRLKVYATDFENEFPEMPQALDMADLAIKALEAYRPEREPCEWCQGLSEKKFIRGNLIEPGEHTSIMANYCPNCGRRLEESE